MFRKVRAISCILLLGAHILGCSEPIENYETLSEKEGQDSKPSSLSITWFGAASVLVDDGSRSLLIDPFLSRKENQPWDIVFQANAKVDKALITKQIDDPNFQRISSILVGHSHYDHSVDVAEFAHQLKVPVYGSPSTLRIVEASDYKNVKAIKDGDVLHSAEVGRGYKVHVLPGRHGAPPFVVDPLDDHVAAEFSVPAPISKYGTGEVHSFLIEHRHGNILHIGSAGVAPHSFDAFVDQVDVVLLSLVGRPETAKYLADVVGKLRPKVVIPIHFDNLFRATEKPIRVVGQADLSGFFTAMEELYPEVATGVLLFDQPWALNQDL